MKICVGKTGGEFWRKDGRILGVNSQLNWSYAKVSLHRLKSDKKWKKNGAAEPAYSANKTRSTHLT